MLTIWLAKKSCNNELDCVSGAGANVGNITNIWARGESVIPGLGRPAPLVERVQVFLKPQSFQATPNHFYFWV